MMVRVIRLNGALAARRIELRILIFYGHTGNLILESSSLAAVDAGKALSAADSTAWIAIAADLLDFTVHEVAEMAPPAPEPDMRWTSGLVFAVTEPTSQTVRSSTRGHFQPLGPTTVAAWKRDRLDGQGRLDRRNRDGGWGAISSDIAAQTGGRWTARSLSTLRGALRLATVRR